jgi:tetratricopeptide (TPR) repeat protein
LGQRRRPAPSQIGTKDPGRKLGSALNQELSIQHPGPQSDLLRDIATGVAIFLAALLAYWPALRGTLIWDDTAHITAPALQSLHGLWRIWFELGATQQYYPLLHSAFWVEHRIWGDAVLGYHLANLTEHTVSSFLVVLIVRRLKLPDAWLAGCIFALHPVCVEAVAWISEQKSTLSGVLYLASALTYLHFDRSRRKSQYLWALGLFVSALLCKTVTATLPAVLLVVFWWKRGRLDWRRDVTPLLPWFVLGASAGIFTAWVEVNYIGAKGTGYDLTLIQHVLLAGRILCFYISKIVWPANLIFSYPHWQVDPTVGWQYLYPLGVLALVAGLLILARRPNGLARRGPLAGFLIFGGTLFPVLGFLHVFPFKYSYVADHFQYLACLGIIVPGAWLIVGSVPQISGTIRNAFGIVVLAILGLLTWQQSGLYRDNETLYRATVVRNPDSWMAHNLLGMILAQTPGRLTDAEAEFEATIRLQPDHAKAHMNLGNVLSQMPGRLPDAIAEYQAALRIWPGYAPAHDNLGIALMQIPERLPDAITEFQNAVRLQPDDAKTHELLALALAQMPGRLPDAVVEYQAALQIQPNDPDLHMNLGDALAQLPGRHREAIAQYEAVLKSRPDSETARQSIERLRALDAQPTQKPVK